MNRVLVFCLGLVVGIGLSYAIWHPVPTYATPRSAQLVPVPPAALTGAPHPGRGNQPGTAAAPLFVGNAGWASPSLGSSYLAMRLPRGTLVTITGPVGSWTARVNDYGPSSKIVPPRIADIAVGHWTHVCGLPPSAGLCKVSVRTGGLTEPNPTAPATDVEP